MSNATTALRRMIDYRSHQENSRNLVRQLCRNCFLHVVLVVVLLQTSLCEAPKSGISEQDKLRSQTLPPCQACKLLVDAFKQGMDRTSRYKFDGGDAAWEEKKQGKYAESEVRLTEIQEDLCKNIVRGQNQCHQLAADNEENFEKWWFEHQKEIPDLFDWFCIQSTQVCCPNNTYGPSCDICPGGIENPCSGNGRCRGAGTRKGTGECQCVKGYTGLLCDQCSTGFFNSSTDEGDRLICSNCHKACKGHCWDGTQSGCEECCDGWIKHPELGCQDIDECYSTVSLCATNEFCVNTEGSYRCLDCDKSCASCSGDGPDECRECKEGYTRRGNLCIDSATWWRLLQTQWGRYLTYLGLCVATCIVFKKSTTVASVIGLMVATYIGVSEYMVSDYDGSPSVNFIPTTKS